MRRISSLVRVFPLRSTIAIACLLMSSGCDRWGGRPYRAQGLEFTDRAVGVPFDRVLVLRQGNELLALRLTAHPTKKGDAVLYEWVRSTVKSRDFSSANLKRGRGESIADLGKGTISIGTLTVDWSMASKSRGWIYWSSDPTHFAICSKVWETFSDASVAGTDEKWYTRGDHPARK